MPSKVAIDPEEPCLGRIRADSVTPPHSPTSIKRCISRVEKTPALALADLFADISCNTPLKERHISILRTGCPGLSPKEPMAIVQTTTVEDPSIPDGRYVIKNRVENIFFAWDNYGTITFKSTTKENVKKYQSTQVNEHSPIIQVFRG